MGEGGLKERAYDLGCRAMGREPSGRDSSGLPPPDDLPRGVPRGSAANLASIEGFSASASILDDQMSKRESLNTVRVRGIGGATGKALGALAVAGAVYGVIRLAKLVTD